MPGRAIVSLLLTIACLFHAALTFADENPPSEPLPEIKTRKVLKSILEKRVLIAALQGEIKQLEAKLTSGRQIEIELKVYEVQRTKLRRLGVEWAAPRDAQPYTKDITTLQPDGQSDASVMHALLSQNIARMASHDKLAVICGEPVTLKKGKEFQLPMSPECASVSNVSENEVTLSAARRADDTYNITLISKLARPIDGQPFRGSGRPVQAVHIQSHTLACESRPNEEMLLIGPSVNRTEAIRTENGTRTEQIEIETWYSIQINENPVEPSLVIQPASALIPAN